ncbi:MAG: hypothetical protein NT154_19425, partial [Verrucomicrobia bacterium]|nr:hypothetical protein [Verrucomicrobiota bacterium]
RAEAGFKETFDSNVYIQDTEPSSDVPGAVPAKKESLVSTISPRVFLDYMPCTAFKATLSYTPDFTWYEDASSEDNNTHRFGVNFGGTVAETVWDLQNSFTYIDGSTDGPIFGRPGDIPAVGGIPLRDRRAAFIYRSGFRYTEMFGKWMVRPVATAYVQDFKTAQRFTPPGADYVYENYIDRQDINGGLDVGYEAVKDLRLILGYRYGRQDQFNAPCGPGGAVISSPYGNTYHRILAGAEGAPLPWLKLGVLAGPDIRQFDNDISGFNANELLYYVDAFVTILPTKQDSITLSNKRFEQPAFSSFSMYEDINYDITWKHRFNDHWAATAGFKLYIGDWQAPVNRDDWIYTPMVGLAYTYNKHLSAELSYSYDWVENQISTSAAGATYADGREFTRNLLSLALKYSL